MGGSRYVFRRNKPSIDDFFILNITHPGCDAKNYTAEELLAILLKVDLGRNLCSNLFAILAVIANPFVVFPLQFLVSAICPFKIVGGQTARKCHPRHHKVVYAENLRDLRHNVSVKPADCGANHYYRRNSNDDADKGKKRTQFVREDRLDRDSACINIK